MPAAPESVLRPARGLAEAGAFRSVSTTERMTCESFSNPKSELPGPPTFCAASTSPGVSRKDLPWFSLLRRYSSSMAGSVENATYPR